MRTLTIAIVFVLAGAPSMSVTYAGDNQTCAGASEWARSIAKARDAGIPQDKLRAALAPTLPEHDPETRAALLNRITLIYGSDVSADKIASVALTTCLSQQAHTDPRLKEK